MYRTKKPKKVTALSKHLAVRLASLRNGVPLATAEKYTDSKLKEICRQAGVKPNF